MEKIILLLEKEPSPVGVSCNIDNYKRSLIMFDKFECSLSHYLLFDKRANEDTFRLWQIIREWVHTPIDTDVQDDNKACLIEWLEQNWRAWLICILDYTDKYMNATKLVLESWEELEK